MCGVQCEDPSLHSEAFHSAVFGTTTSRYATSIQRLTDPTTFQDLCASKTGQVGLGVDSSIVNLNITVQHSVWAIKLLDCTRELTHL